MTSVVPGWYPDPSGAPLQRYWDGWQWTPHTQAAPDAVQMQMLEIARSQNAAQQQSARSVERIRGLIVMVIVAAIVIYAIIRINQNIN